MFSIHALFDAYYSLSSQLCGHRHLRPKSIRSPEVLEGFAADFLYLEAVRAIQTIKLASFAEHSPLLNDISGMWGRHGREQRTLNSASIQF